MDLESIKDNRDFKKVYHKGRSYANKFLVMYAMKNNSDLSRRGISVSKKVGNSVVRHRVTRLIRESIRLNQGKIKQGYDIVIIARNAAKDRGYREIESAFLHLCRLHHLVKEDDKD
ncbi:MAG: ribonuclease P protein component [Catonella sp.]|jgi:ribonuclease P protein component|nr:ribonuclease P protein component [Catonella sp.]MDY6357848.1 ribonuclease P protein component [Catonella sp.]